MLLAPFGREIGVVGNLLSSGWKLASFWTRGKFASYGRRNWSKGNDASQWSPDGYADHWSLLVAKFESY